MRRTSLILLITLLAVSVAALLLFYPLLVGGRGSGGRYFLVDVSGERFIIYVTDEETIRLAEDNLRGLNNLFPTGELERGDGGFNKPWSWHLRPDTVRMAEFSIELCDGLPSYVESELDYWIDTVGRYCPWSGRIIASADSPAELHAQSPNK
ncbi:hypothetical protein HRbin02_00350 [Candidatus Calditenuaceae archaeon HR02]|nr:hypothetical protein HRbin02_00350 [Candidatus Calditenuaceae archaeon HR02]